MKGILAERVTGAEADVVLGAIDLAGENVGARGVEGVVFRLAALDQRDGFLRHGRQVVVAHWRDCGER